MKVFELEQELFTCFPATDAELWDRVGLSVGSPDDAVQSICCALDATPSTVAYAAQVGANVLLTHHPAFLDPPVRICPPGKRIPSSAATVYKAIEMGVSIISMHTNLDRSLMAREWLARHLGLQARASLEHPEDSDLPGLGFICDAPQAMNLRVLAEHTGRALRTTPRVWGDPDRSLSRIAVLGGSLGSFGEAALRAEAEVIITGEAGYHVCQDLAARGSALILVGHDRSEEPFVGLLQKTAAEIAPGVSTQRIDLHTKQWWTQQEGYRS
ncbi:Nif3-like dinuclear metal center hexameric protein [Collinsella sp. AGMB00827]|uniref:GTP cyclohydrolase 1 type 2 homolog n=1 Tax=Collinsella ureilytica TaxID=2869515 RepID=A0ABS7MKW3_9ACTN|nr:Nif3-like dinuclear metal center hexameric protein [Collinsella urealyticum]MBY4798011.1 Nif3-like dinuclear metal center hexameric protein [Collinsella urealyticum]